MISRIRLLATIALLLTFIAAAGCGGSDASDNAATVSQIETFANQQLALRLEAGQTADPFACEEDGDDQWKCTTEVRTDNPDSGDDEAVELTVKVTCDAAASCVYEPET